MAEIRRSPVDMESLPVYHQKTKVLYISFWLAGFLPSTVSLSFISGIYLCFLGNIMSHILRQISTLAGLEAMEGKAAALQHH